MGTRSLTFVYDGDKPIINMYRQYDGYPEGHGRELAEFLMFGEMVNGFSNENAREWSGMGCLAAQMIAHFKKSVGGFYIYPVDSTDHWQEYEYHIYENRIVINDTRTAIFSGTYTEFLTFCTPANVEETA